MKRIYISILFFLILMGAYAFGRTEAQYRSGLENYPITILPNSLPRTAYDYVFIDAEKIMLVDKSELIEIDFSTNKRKIIDIPQELKGRNLRNLKYDHIRNSVHMLFGRVLSGSRYLWSYFILYLNNYTWEEIEELDNEINWSYYFDPINMYVNYPSHRRNESDSVEIVTIIKTFDLNKREFLEHIELPQGTGSIFCIFGSPMKILADIKDTSNSNNRHLFIFDTTTGEKFDFPEMSTNITSEFSFIINNLIPFHNDNSFIGVGDNRSNSSNISILNLNTETIEVVALNEFPYKIYNFKEVTNGRYSFIVTTRTLAGGHGPNFLCIWEYYGRN